MPGDERSRFSTAFARAVRRARLAAKLTQEKLAEAAGVHPVYVSMVERGESIPTVEVAHRIATALGKTLSTLVADAERAMRGRS